MNENLQMVEDCEDRQSRMTDWEVVFMASVWEALDDGHPLSEKQKEILDKIWEKVTEEG